MGLPASGQISLNAINVELHGASGGEVRLSQGSLQNGLTYPNTANTQDLSLSAFYGKSGSVLYSVPSDEEVIIPAAWGSQNSLSPNEVDQYNPYIKKNITISSSVVAATASSASAGISLDTWAGELKIVNNGAVYGGRGAGGQSGSGGTGGSEGSSSVTAGYTGGAGGAGGAGANGGPALDFTSSFSSSLNASLVIENNGTWLGGAGGGGGGGGAGGGGGSRYAQYGQYSSQQINFGAGQAAGSCSNSCYYSFGAGMTCLGSCPPNYSRPYYSRYTCSACYKTVNTTNYYNYTAGSGYTGEDGGLGGDGAYYDVSTGAIVPATSGGALVSGFTASTVSQGNSPQQTYQRGGTNNSGAGGDGGAIGQAGNAGQSGQAGQTSANGYHADGGAGGSGGASGSAGVAHTTASNVTITVTNNGTMTGY